MVNAPAPHEVFFSEPRLEMTAAGRFIVRAISSVAYGLTAVGAVVFLLTDLRPLRMAGMLIALFIIHRSLHFGKSERSLHEPPAGRVNAARYLTPQSYRVLEVATDHATLMGGDFLFHLLERLVERNDVRDGLARLDVAPDDFAAQASARLEESLHDTRSSKTAILEMVTRIATSALNEASGNHDEAIEPRDLLAAMTYLPDERFQKLLVMFEIDPAELRAALALSGIRERLSRGGKRARGAHRITGVSMKKRHRVMNRAWTARPTPTLDRFSTDLTDRARLGFSATLFGHAQEYQALVDVLSRPGNPDALLVGEPGAGKGPIIEHLAYQVTRDRVPPPLFDRRLVSLEIGSVLAGADEGELARRMRAILDEILLAGNIILYLPDIHNLVKTSGAQQMNGADILIPAIKGADFSVVGGTYPREFKQFLEPVSDFIGSFELIRIEELGEADAVKFLLFAAAELEMEYGIVVSFKAVRESVKLAHQFFRDKLLPQSAEELLKETIADAAEKGKSMLSEDDVVAQAERRTKVPLHKVRGAEAQELLNLESMLSARLVGQKPAVEAVARALREYRAGLTRKGGPIAEFLFVGPTGVGKTQLAKLLAAFQFGAENAMLRFDMSEYQTKESITRFIGAPDGTTRGALTDAVHERPYSLILLDEFEKAHPDILNLFLQVFDDGRLTDNFGRTVDFTNTIIIATSNAHADILMDAIRKGESVPKVAEYFKTKLVDSFKPELLNRFTEIVVFKELAPEDIRTIARLNLEELAANLKTTHQIELTADEAAIGELMRRGYDPAFGARPLRRVIEQELRSALADKILKNEVKRGDKLALTFHDNAFVFQAVA